jgi:murein DD-endopeptidase MepM/ murein hydrolase activator NlpD
MSKVIEGSKGRVVIRLALAGLGASLLAGCADSGRFGGNDDPLGNPYKTSSRVDRGATGTVDPVPSNGPIQSRPLASPGPVSSNYSAPAHSSPQLASAQAAPHADMTGSVAHAGGVAGWSATGGTPVVVATGETADTIATRYGIPRDALVHTNGFGSASEIKPGTRLVIPVYNASLAASSGVAPAAAPHAEKLKFVKGPEPASKAETHVAALKEAVKPGNEKTKDKAGAKMASRAPAAKEPAMKMAMKEQPAAKAPLPREQPPVKAAVAKKPEPAKAEPVKTAKAEVQATEVKKSVDATPTASLPSSKATETAPASDSANPEFRWPAHGRIIQGFKAGGNDGINIAVPEGTAVKAVEGGVVAYAGSELKGYGNLVLIRHPNGFVSAYANNSDIEVKRGDTVKRGQQIAKSGQSGNVASPQLHFELRKGSTPVDPTQYLAGL